MTRVNLSFKKDPEAFRTFFGDDELQSENKRLYNLLSEAIESVNIYGRVVLLKFKGNIVALVELFDFDNFKLRISDTSLYEYDDDHTTKMSKDRILHYLRYISNVALLEG
jgi:hypothetical protein